MGSSTRLVTLRMQLVVKMSWTEERETPMIFSAILTTAAAAAEDAFTSSSVKRGENGLFSVSAGSRDAVGLLGYGAGVDLKCQSHSYLMFNQFLF